ncbi:hypothetical protein A6R68_03167 [Neotoma lepida]|uniref:Vomeronasal type-1 receptor n=1 Tax=Neotoma lepida TaxID=56216 RepID=A0A1A6GQY5_NEOLE|nr:hypothetical protein A6R68_03167 [Neotoma lepida]
MAMSQGPDGRWNPMVMVEAAGGALSQVSHYSVKPANQEELLLLEHGGTKCSFCGNTLLIRHKKQVRYIHNQAPSKSRQNHETRATRTILILASALTADS